MLKFTPYLSSDELHPYDTVEWKKEDIEVRDSEENVIFQCPNAEFPTTWSDLAKRTVAQKYFRGSRESKNLVETSLREIIERVVLAIQESGIKQKYFTEAQSSIFANELRMILLMQIASFNSPVWFNLGVPGVKEPQCSACFINKVDDDMSSILQLAKVEGLIFKEGSGTGTNFSSLRGSNERIRGGGKASGPVSFMQGYDAFANVILSGGRTRRAARMCILDIDHPDILKFVNCKMYEESIVERLIKTGMSADYRRVDSAYGNAKHQSGNNSVRITDKFMEAVKEWVYFNKDADWELHNRTDKNTPNNTTTVGVLFDAIAHAAHACGDPGVQFHDHVNKMNTCANDEEIRGSNPCGEFVWLDGSACNLASINLDKFTLDNRKFGTKLFKHVVNIMVIAQDILIDTAGYPTKQITKNSHQYRPIGLGYTNLGGLLMSWGIPYDSAEGRDLAASITALMTGQAYLTSAEIARVKGAFERYSNNRTCMEDVLVTQHARVKQLKDKNPISTQAMKVWREVVKVTDKGFRNSQVTLLAPTGTISFMMDCSTTGIEPDIGLKKTKSLVGGEVIKYINPSVKVALEHLGYRKAHVTDLLEYIDENWHLEGSSLQKEHLSIFDCSLPGGDTGKRSISIEGHINMAAAVQPFLSGAISKTFNMPNKATVTDVRKVFLMAWEKKLKGVTIYRFGSKMNEPMRVAAVKSIESPKPKRNKPPKDLDGPRHEFSVAGHKGYMHIGLDPQTREPVEMFVRMARWGSTIGGLFDAFATLFSIALQFGIPFRYLVDHMESTKFPPAGVTTNPDIPTAQSIMDYIAKYCRLTILKDDVQYDENTVEVDPLNNDIPDLGEDTCPECGHPLIRAGSCTYCRNCPFHSGTCG